MGDQDYFRTEQEGRIVWLVLNRPEKRNTMDQGFLTGMAELFSRFENDDNVRVIIIKAEGKSFCAGLDLAGSIDIIPKDPSPSQREIFRRWIMAMQECITSVERCRKPVIAAIHGHCVGGGIDLTSACDVRLASLDAVFSVRETRMAMIADFGTLQRLPAIIGQGWFRELALTGRDFSSEEAYRMGFITHLCEDRESLYARARAIAEEIASCSAFAVQGTKEVIMFNRDNGIRAGLEYVAQKNSAVLPNDDLEEAVRAFREKRPPRFK